MHGLLGARDLAAHSQEDLEVAISFNPSLLSSVAWVPLGEVFGDINPSSPHSAVAASPAARDGELAIVQKTRRLTDPRADSSDAAASRIEQLAADAHGTPTFWSPEPASFRFAFDVFVADSAGPLVEVLDRSMREADDSSSDPHAHVSHHPLDTALVALFNGGNAFAKPPQTKPVWSLDQIVQNFDRWHAAWPPGTVVRYTFYNELPEAHAGDQYYAGFVPFNSEQREAVRSVLTLISDIANIWFVEVADNGQTPWEDHGKIGFANSSTMPNYAWGWSAVDWTLPQISGRYSIYGSEVWINAKYGIASYAPGTTDLSGLMHEIGHSLGLPHPGEYDAGNGGRITYANSAEYQQDSWMYTVMSYFEAFNTGADHLVYYAATPLLHDVAALQFKYGSNTTTRVGDTVYGFNSTAGRKAFDFSANPHPIVTIWDAGGIDTIDLSGFSQRSLIDLNEGALSDAAGMTKNISISFGTIIEQAIGGTDNDELIGNLIANRLDGGAGNDRLVGGGGDDTLIGSAGNDVLIGGAGKDVMLGGPGHDVYRVGGGDTVSELAGQGTDRVLASVSYTLPANVENLAAANPVGTAALNFTGNSLGNRIQGNDGANVLNGRGGNDLLEGRDGADTFFFNTALDGAGNVDTIGDYSVADDSIRLENAVFAGLADGTLSAAAFCIGSAAADASDRIIYDAATGALLFDADGIGGAAATRFATIAAGLAMTHAEFMVV
jgi:Ca2+-binding RTX toxin-like protein